MYQLSLFLGILKNNKCRKNNTFRIMERSQLKLCKYCDSGKLKKAGMRKRKNEVFKFTPALTAKRGLQLILALRR